MPESEDMMTKKNHLYAVILAGGSGTRFWPKSRRSFPKQFLKIIGDRSLFQKTLARLSPGIDGRHVYVLTNRRYRGTVLSQARPFHVPPSQVLLEPEGKNTAPAICWAAGRIYKKDKEAVLAVLPSDHLIRNRRAFGAALRRAVDLAGRDFLVTFGIVPTRPETGYGYLKTATAGRGGKKVCRVAKFIEKPDAGRARAFVKNKNYLWNSGMFVWKAGVILDAFRWHQPRLYAALGAGPSDAAVRRVWSRLRSISVDYGILEKADNVAAVPAKDLGWSDLGSWQSLVEVLPKDRGGNLADGKVMALSCRNTAVFGGNRLVTAIGLDDIIVVDTPDALLVCRREASQKVRDAVAIVKKQYKNAV